MNIPGYHGVILRIDLTTEQAEPQVLREEDLAMFLGGRGLGMKLLWDSIEQPGLDPLSPENPLLFMTGPFSGFPIPSASRVIVVTKSPCTSPVQSEYPSASTVSYSNMGGFFGPEIRFAGYDGIMIVGKAASPVYIVVADDRVEIRSAKEFWGMNTDQFDQEFTKTLDDKDFRTCYIGPAGENKVAYACILHTTARAAGRGVGAVMGSKNLKAIAVKGTRMPGVADHKQFLSRLEASRKTFTNFVGKRFAGFWRESGTAMILEDNSKNGRMTVKNYQEGTFLDVSNIGADAAREQAWVRDFACYCCHLACKKSGVVKNGSYPTIVHDGPEYETGTMFGANLMVSDFNGMMKAIYDGDDFGMDIISAGNVIGFLMEAYEKGLVQKSTLDGIDLTWGNVDGILQMIQKIAHREGIGDLAARGVKAVSEEIGQDSVKFAIHVKGLELAAHNIQANPDMALCYATANRGACHLSGDNVEHQNFVAAVDSLGLCVFASDHSRWYFPGLGQKEIARLLSPITGADWTKDTFMTLGERVFNLEKMFNYREGFRRSDDTLPDRFFEEPFTIGKKKGKKLDREKFRKMLDKFYREREWDPETTKPEDAKLKELGLDFV